MIFYLTDTHYIRIQIGEYCGTIFQFQIIDFLGHIFSAAAGEFIVIFFRIIFHIKQIFHIPEGYP